MSAAVVIQAVDYWSSTNPTVSKAYARVFCSCGFRTKLYSPALADEVAVRHARNQHRDFTIEHQRQESLL